MAGSVAPWLLGAPFPCHTRPPQQCCLSRTWHFRSQSSGLRLAGQSAFPSGSLGLELRTINKETSVKATNVNVIKCERPWGCAGKPLCWAGVSSPHSKLYVALASDLMPLVNPITSPLPSATQSLRGTWTVRAGGEPRPASAVRDQLFGSFPPHGLSRDHGLFPCCLVRGTGKSWKLRHQTAPRAGVGLMRLELVLQGSPCSLFS